MVYRLGGQRGRCGRWDAMLGGMMRGYFSQSATFPEPVNVFDQQGAISIDAAIERFIAALMRLFLPHLDASVALHAGDQVFGGEFVIIIRRAIGWEVTIPGAGIGDSQASDDLALELVHADNAETQGAGSSATEATVGEGVGGGLNGVGAFERCDVGAMNVTIAIDAVCPVPACVDTCRAQANREAEFVLILGVQESSHGVPRGSGLPFGDVGIAGQDLIIDVPALIRLSPADHFDTEAINLHVDARCEQHGAAGDRGWVGFGPGRKIFGLDLARNTVVSLAKHGVVKVLESGRVTLGFMPFRDDLSQCDVGEWGIQRIEAVSALSVTEGRGGDPVSACAIGNGHVFFGVRKKPGTMRAAQTHGVEIRGAVREFFPGHMSPLQSVQRAATGAGDMVKTLVGEGKCPQDARSRSVGGRRTPISLPSMECGISVTGALGVCTVRRPGFFVHVAGVADRWAQRGRMRAPCRLGGSPVSVSRQNEQA